MEANRSENRLAFPGFLHHAAPGCDLFYHRLLTILKAFTI